MNRLALYLSCVAALTACDKKEDAKPDATGIPKLDIK